MKQMMRYGNGHTLSFTEYGDRNGFPILIQHGLIASISDYDLFGSLLEVGTHFVCIARPGYGESSPYIMRDMAEWGEIVSVLVDERQFSQFDVLGMSSGAPYSYAIGYMMPNKVRNIFIFSGTPALYDDQVLSCWPYPVDRNASLIELEKLAKDLFFSNCSAEDLLRDDIKDSMMNDCFGIAQDFQLRCHDWGFSLSDVGAFVYMQHGKEDQQVPLITAQMTAKLLPNCRFEVRDRGEHFSNQLLDDFIKTDMIEHYQSK
jgi:pimeloyl-ACP methyl ester carboxylesterase